MAELLREAERLCAGDRVMEGEGEAVRESSWLAEREGLEVLERLGGVSETEGLELKLV